MKNPYLLENTPEALEMRQKVKDLLLSRTKANAQLALQLLQGGGVHSELVPYLWGLTYATLDIRTTSVEKLLMKYLSAEQISLYKELKALYIGRYEKYEWENADEAWADFALHILATHEATQAMFRDFAIAFLMIAQKGGRRLLRFKLLPEEMIVRELIDGQYLSLEDFDLPALPACVGEFEDLKQLNLRGNRIADVPDSFAKLKNLEYLEFSMTLEDFEIPQSVIDKFEAFFPAIMAERYQTSAWNFVEINDIEKGIEYFEKSIQLVQNSSKFWNNLAWAYSHAHHFDKAFEASKKAIDLAENVTQKASYLSNKASDEQRAGLLKECEESAQEVRNILKQVPNKMWQESDYFSFALATQILGKFEEALAYYEKYEQKGGYADGSLYYNKACIYARLGDREKMSDMMRLCVDHDSLDWVAEMRHDMDFQAFWEDSIIEELEQYAIEQQEKLPF